MQLVHFISQSLFLGVGFFEFFSELLYFASLKFFLAVGQSRGLFQLLLQFTDPILISLFLSVGLELVGLEFLHFPLVGQAFLPGLRIREFEFEFPDFLSELFLNFLLIGELLFEGLVENIHLLGQFALGWLVRRDQLLDVQLNRAEFLFHVGDEGRTRQRTVVLDGFQGRVLPLGPQTRGIGAVLQA